MSKESTSNEDQQDPFGIKDQSDDRDPEQGVGWNEFLTELFKPSNIYSKDRAHLDALPNRYPRLFQEGELTWGFQVSPGWSNLISLLCARVDTILQSTPEASMQVKQVKEKFGRLRFYYSIEDAPPSVQDAILQAVRQAENASGMCCEKCGKRAETTSDRGWLRTLCLRCSAMS